MKLFRDATKLQVWEGVLQSLLNSTIVATSSYDKVKENKGKQCIIGCLWSLHPSFPHGDLWEYEPAHWWMDSNMDRHGTWARPSSTSTGVQIAMRALQRCRSGEGYGGVAAKGQIHHLYVYKAKHHKLKRPCHTNLVKETPGTFLWWFPSQHSCKTLAIRMDLWKQWGTWNEKEAVDNKSTENKEEGTMHGEIWRRTERRV